jgi:hypothetical protein
MDAKGEKQAAESRARHHEEYRRQHNITDAEWERAKESESALQEELHEKFWDLYDENPGLWAETQRKEHRS